MYHDPDIFELEKQCIFSRAWIVELHTSAVQASVRYRRRFHQTPRDWAMISFITSEEAP
jgi:phenylpropionate dioxygenase-like ring-hydroxylating dioxygenase large terminal subunit